MTGAFFLICQGPGEDHEHEVDRLQKAFAALGFSPPEMVEAERWVVAAYPKFQHRSGGLKGYPDGDFAFVCGTCLSEGVGLSDASFYTICSVLSFLTLSQQSAYEYVFNGVVSGNETLSMKLSWLRSGDFNRFAARVANRSSDPSNDLVHVAKEADVTIVTEIGYSTQAPCVVTPEPNNVEIGINQFGNAPIAINMDILPRII